MSIVTLFWIAVAAAASPVLSRLTRGHVPDVVVLLVLGMILGPYVLDWGDPSKVEILSDLGLGMLFLLAGYELDPDLLRGRSGRLAQGSWLVSFGLAIGVATLVVPTSGFATHIAVAIALTSTALGTLLPILKQSGVLGSALGRSVMAHGAVGELAPILAMSLLLTSRSFGAAALVLIMFLVAALVIAAVPTRILTRNPGINRVFEEMSGGTVQLPIRVVFLLLVALMAVAAVFDLDVVLGAFAAGLILRRLIGADHPTLGRALEVIGFGVLIPIFFVTSGMGISVSAVAGEPLLWLALVVGIGVIRGVPVWLGERFIRHPRRLASGRDRIRLGLYAATGLPIIVAVTDVAVDADLMRPAMASTLVAAGATTVLVFPLLARWVGSRGGGEEHSNAKRDATPGEDVTPRSS